MATSTNEKNDDRAPTCKKLEDLYELIDGIEMAMMTSRLPDGTLVSRPMATQDRREGTDLWFMTNEETGKVTQLEHDPHVNLAYYKNGEFVSVSGVAKLTKDRSRVHELYAPDWKAWLGDEGGARDGGPDDPRIMLIEVEAQAVTPELRREDSDARAVTNFVDVIEDQRSAEKRVKGVLMIVLTHSGSPE